MKKIVLLLFMLLGGAASSFAYENGVGIFAASSDSNSGSPTEDTEIININSYTEIEFRCNFTSGALGVSSTSSAYAYLKHGGTLIDYFNFERIPYAPFSAGKNAAFTGYWYSLELKISCASNAIGLAELRW
ncbi:hypothetical protein [Pararcticibacter amylolyticus]|uniref:Uncharacterized protein n=1 Tax=Pararcticibacter amylolyticus TaxID=2173175 RepID=A0A2U2PJ73_9SPHI|nr:hypothetical protein [Pararcticibacter amylolyticus]PWG81314.1 hypothetical protein DDR33_08055 [Pararcticibacter amylolyticus]